MISVTWRSSLYDQGHLNLFYSKQSQTINHYFLSNRETFCTLYVVLLLDVIVRRVTLDIIRSMERTVL